MDARNSKTLEPNPCDRHILIVDDDDMSLDASVRFLRLCGYSVAGAHNFSESMAASIVQSPDVAICDWQLNDVQDGVDVARYLQQQYGIKVIIVTGQPLDEVEEAAQDLEVAYFVRKPLSLASLLDKINSIEG